MDQAVGKDEQEVILWILDLLAETVRVRGPAPPPDAPSPPRGSAAAPPPDASSPTGGSAAAPPPDAPSPTGGSAAAQIPGRVGVGSRDSTSRSAVRQLATVFGPRLLYCAELSPRSHAWSSSNAPIAERQVDLCEAMLQWRVQVAAGVLPEPFPAVALPPPLHGMLGMPLHPPIADAADAAERLQAQSARAPRASTDHGRPARRALSFNLLRAKAKWRLPGKDSTSQADRTPQPPPQLIAPLQQPEQPELAGGLSVAASSSTEAAPGTSAPRRTSPRLPKAQWFGVELASLTLERGSGHFGR